MSKTRKFFVVLLAVCAVCAAILLTLSTLQNDRAEVAEPLFRLQSIDGLVTLFEGDTAVETFPQITVTNLPTEDRAALQNGMDFSDRDAARQRIEDFDG